MNTALIAPSYKKVNKQKRENYSGVMLLNPGHKIYANVIVRRMNVVICMPVT